MIEYEINIKSPVTIQGTIKLELGNITLIYGDIGTGKTTILKHILKTCSDIAYLSQAEFLIDEFSVEECFNSLNINQDRARYYLCKFSLEDYLNEKCNHLSLGQKQRVAIAILLSSHYKTILLDEPIAHLDEDAAKSVIEAIDEAKNNFYIIITSHDLSLTNKSTFIYNTHLDEIKNTIDKEISLIKVSYFNKLNGKNYIKTDTEINRNYSFIRFFITIIFSILLIADFTIPYLIINHITKGYGGYVILNSFDNTHHFKDLHDFSLSKGKYGENQCSIRPYIFDELDMNVYILKSDQERYNLSIGDKIVVNHQELIVNHIIDFDYPKIDEGICVYTNQIKGKNLEFIGRPRRYDSKVQLHYVDPFLTTLLFYGEQWIYLFKIICILFILITVFFFVLIEIKIFTLQLYSRRYLISLNVRMNEIIKCKFYQNSYMLIIPFGIVLFILDCLIEMIESYYCMKYY